ncbi:MAG: glycosyltransferase family 39 protein [Acidobacteriota bacterium]
MTDEGAVAAGEPRWAKVVILAIAVGGLVLRLVSLLAVGGPLASPSSYDDGVYYSASALLFRGVLPYRDFVFVHPPGLLYFYGLAWSFASARILAAVVGAVSVVLVGRIVLRRAGAFGGILAAVLYAVYPEAVTAERSVSLEPILNLACLAMAYVWLSDEERPRRSVLGGILLGAACAVKVLGGIWLLAALASVPRGRFRAEAWRFIGVAAVCGALLLAPLALPNLPGFVQQTLAFHSLRPPDGVLAPGDRLPLLMTGAGHVAASVLALLSLTGILKTLFMEGWPRITREERFFAVATLLTVAAFLASASYWVEYNAHLAASECVLAGLFAVSAHRLPRASRDAVLVAVTMLVVVLQIPSFRELLAGSHARAPEQLAVGRAIREHVPAGDCVFAFDPTWTLAAGRLPPHGDGAPVVVDSYAAMLLDAVADGARFPDAAAAFQRPLPQREVRARLEACRYAVLGQRGNWQLNAANRDWFQAHYFCVDPREGELCVWERMDRPFAGIALLSQGQVAFGEGWYSEERGGTESVALDGRARERFTPTSGAVIRSYKLDVRR